jgi:hypothetical protein
VTTFECGELNEAPSHKSPLATSETDSAIRRPALSPSHVCLHCGVHSLIGSWSDFGLWHGREIVSKAGCRPSDLFGNWLDFNLCPSAAKVLWLWLVSIAVFTVTTARKTQRCHPKEPALDFITMYPCPQFIVLHALLLQWHQPCKRFQCIISTSIDCALSLQAIMVAGDVSQCEPACCPVTAMP